MDIFCITLICIHGAFVSIEETAKAADFFRADGLIVTGSATGDPASPQKVILVVDDDCDWQISLPRSFSVVMEQ